VKKPVFYLRKCAKTHLPQSRIQKFFRGRTPGPPRLKGEGREGGKEGKGRREGEGRDRGRGEGRVGGGEGRRREREGKGVSPPSAHPV